MSMKKSTYLVSEAQSQLPRLLKAAEGGQTISIRRRDETVAYLISRHHLESLVETLEVLSNPEAMHAIAQHRNGKTRWYPLSALDDE